MARIAANDDLYVAADAAVGRIVEAAPADARIVVFAVHGMARNDGWSEYFPRLLFELAPRLIRVRIDPRDFELLRASILRIR